MQKFGSYNLCYFTIFIFLSIIFYRKYLFLAFIHLSYIGSTFFFIMLVAAEIYEVKE